jgi:hypothetical protein
MDEFNDLRQVVMDRYNNEEMVGPTFESALNTLMEGVYKGGRTTGRKEEIAKIRVLANKVELASGEIVYQIPAKEIDEPTETEGLWFGAKETEQ